MAEVRIPFDDVLDKLHNVLLNYGFSEDKARLAASLFTKASLDGVASHGLNRFPDFLRMISKGYVKPGAEPVQTGKFGSFERWDGKLGPGNLNAYFCMNRTIDLAHENGLGCVALRNTNHWMRGGNYGWQAVEKNCIGICVTNTKPNLPAWGGSEVKLGNNPLVIAIPHQQKPVVLDLALSQYAYGKIAIYLKAGKQLPYDGGFDHEGNITKEPATILEKEMGLPIGLWKGAGLSLVLDLLISLLSEGDATAEIGQKEEEYGISQFFLCFHLPKLGIEEFPKDKVEAILEDLKSSEVFGEEKVRYPGENTLKVRRENEKRGIPVDPDIWEEISDIS